MSQDGIEITEVDTEDWGTILAAAASPVLLGARTLAGDLRDALLELVRDLREPWHKIGERQQQFYAKRVQDRCMALVGEMVGIIAASDFAAIPATIKDSKVKDSIEVKLVLSKHDEHRHELLDATGSEVMVVLTDARQFMGARGAPLIDRDEPELPIGEKDEDGPLFTEVETDARATGRLNGLCGHRDNAARFEEGSQARAEYESGHAEGSAERTSRLGEARRLGAEAARANPEGVGDDNPYPLSTAEHEEWAGGHLDPDSILGPKKRTRRSKTAAAMETT